MFLNSITTSTSEFVAKIFTACLILRIGLKWHLNAALLLNLVGCLLILFIPEPTQVWWTSVFLLITRYGTAMTIPGIYGGIVAYMPTNLISTAIGICNIFARILSICGPIFAELPVPWPMLSMTFMICIAFVAI